MSLVRTVNNLCEARLNELDLTPKQYNENILCNSFIAGGAILSVTKEEKIKDYDLFVTTAASARSLVNTFLRRIQGGDTLQLITEVDEVNPKISKGVLSFTQPDRMTLPIEDIIDNFNQLCKKQKSKGKLQPVYLSKNAITLSNGVQVIFRFIGEPEDVFSTFDYEHCKVYWRPKPQGLLLGSLVYTGRSQESIAKNELIYTGNTRFVLSAISRLNKFIKRGWGISPSSLLSLAVTASKIDWSNRKVLEEELLGIYGIENKTLQLILDMCSTENKMDLDKVVQVLGEV
jgi:hypothetical protein